MDIPLPEDPPVELETLEDIPVPDDANSRYSPSLPIEDDPPDMGDEIAVISLPSQPEKPEVPSISVLGKEAAKKRLLAFSLSKQSIQTQKKIKPNQTENISIKEVLKDSDSKILLPKKKKKGVLDKARDIISEIEEIKRRENEVRESMQLLYPMWGSLDVKAPTVPTLIIPDGLDKTDRIETMVEKLISKKTMKDKKELERIEREEERRRKKEKREKERRRLSPHSWSEFTNSGFKAYHFRRVKYKREKLTDSKHRRQYDHERDGHKKINLLDTPMVLRKSLIATGINKQEIEFPNWAVKHTLSWPRITYCYNPKEDKSWFMPRREMLSTMPDNIYQIVKQFFSASYLYSFSRFPLQLRVLFLAKIIGCAF